MRFNLVTYGAWALIGPLMLFLAGAYALPFLGVVGWSFTLPTVGIGRYHDVLTDPLVRAVLFRTLRICIVATVISVTAGFVIACVWTRGTPRQRILIEYCIFLPFWISVLTRAFGWLALLSTRGMVNSALLYTGAISDPLSLVRNEIGVVIGMIHLLIPFAVFPLASSLRMLDERILLAARGMGASSTRIFWQILVPMTVPGIVGATLVVFVFSLGFFITPAILGGGRTVMAAELIYLRMFQAPDWGLGAAISVTMVVVVAALLAALFRYVKAVYRV